MNKQQLHSLIKTFNTQLMLLKQLREYEKSVNETNKRTLNEAFLDGQIIAIASIHNELVTFANLKNYEVNQND